MLCPCGSEKAYSQCCQPIIEKEKSASSAEQLMRSRYSAYALKNAHYIYDTYAIQSRKSQTIADIQEWANETKWVKLVIHQAIKCDDPINAQVEFSAFYSIERQIFEMREISNFVIENDAWFYLDGEVLFNEEVLKPKRNDACFCHSQKKFKICCSKNC